MRSLKEAAKTLEIGIKKKPLVKYQKRTTDAYKKELKDLESSGLIRYANYLDLIVSALERGVDIPREFYLHVLNREPLKDLFSVIVGELPDSDVTFVLVFRKKGQFLDLLLCDTHQDAYKNN